jgi:hypothetical protein
MSLRPDVNIVPLMKCQNTVRPEEWAFGAMLFCQIDILSTWQFVELTLCELGILSTWLFVNLAFCQLVILST